MRQTTASPPSSSAAAGTAAASSAAAAAPAVSARRRAARRASRRSGRPGQVRRGASPVHSPPSQAAAIGERCVAATQRQRCWLGRGARHRASWLTAQPAPLPPRRSAAAFARHGRAASSSAGRPAGRAQARATGLQACRRYRFTGVKRRQRCGGAVCLARSSSGAGVFGGAAVHRAAHLPRQALRSGSHAAPEPVRPDSSMPEQRPVDSASTFQRSSLEPGLLAESVSV